MHSYAHAVILCCVGVIKIGEDFKVVYDASWLFGKIGPPGLTKFHVEYVTKPHRYIGTNMMGINLSEIVEKVLVDAKRNTVGRMLIAPVVLNEICSFKLMNCERL